MIGENIVINLNNDKIQKLLHIGAICSPHALFFIIMLEIGIALIIGDSNNSIILFFSCYSTAFSLASWTASYKDFDKETKIGAFFWLFIVCTALIWVLLCILNPEQRAFVCNSISVFFMLITITIEGLVFYKSE